MLHADDTIVAIATAWAPSSVGMIRVSGPQAREIVERLTRKTLRDWAICHARIYDIESKTIIDDVIVSYMAAPRSYTGEDVVEISAHGSIPVLARIRTLLVRQGARQADPGEFSQRAYINGKIDLAKAESILSIIEAKTEACAQSAASQLFGSLSTKIYDLSESLRNLLADIEASVDYPEDVGGHEDHWVDALRFTSESVKDILMFAKHGELMRSGISVAIVGPPNAGKSSLLNRLLSQNRAIVSDEPGTTRDVLIESLSIRGIPCEIIDTAGIRSQTSRVEADGIERAHQAIREADIVLIVLDATSDISIYINEYCGYVSGKPALFLANKLDLLDKIQMNLAREIMPPNGVMISVKENKEIDKVLDSLYQIITGSSIDLGTAYFINERQVDAMTSALDSIQLAEEKICDGKLVEADIDLRLAIQSLDDVNGALLSDDIIGRVFSRFCVGK